MDICRSMSLSYDKLASNLNNDQRNHFEEFYKGDAAFIVMRQKYVHLYEYMDGLKIFERT